MSAAAAKTGKGQFARQTAREIILGILLSALVAVSNVSLVALIFKGEQLQKFFADGLLMIFMAGAVAGVVSTILSGNKITIAAAQSVPLGTLAALTTIITREEAFAALAPEAQFATILCVLMTATLLVGVTLLLLSALRLGVIGRYIPYPVMGGFLGGVGVIFVLGALPVMTGSATLDFSTVSALRESANALVSGGLQWRWGGGFFVGLALILANRVLRINYNIVVIVGQLLAVGAFYLVWCFGFGESVDAAMTGGWLIGRFPEGGAALRFLAPEAYSFMLAGFDFAYLTGGGGILLTLLIVTVLHFFLQVNSLEIYQKQDIPAGRELLAAGAANIFAGLTGGFICYVTAGHTYRSYGLGGRTPLVGLLTATVTLGAIVFYGVDFLQYVPRVVVGGGLVFLGLDLILTWLFNARKDFNFADYLNILLVAILVVIAGFVAAIGAGLLMTIGIFIGKYCVVSPIRRHSSGAQRRSNVKRSPAEFERLAKFGEAAAIIELSGYLFFATAATMMNRIRKIIGNEQTPIRYFLLDFHAVSGIDSSVAQRLVRLLHLAQKRGQTLVVTSLDDKVRRLIIQGEMSSALGRGLHLFSSLDAGLEWIEDELLAGQKAAAKEQSGGVLPKLLAGFASSGITEAELYFLPRAFARDEYLYRQNTEPEALYFIEAGVLSERFDLGGGRVKRLRKLLPGAVAGEIEWCSGMNRQSSLVAESNVTAKVLTLQNFKTLCAKFPEVRAIFGEFMAELMAEETTEAIAVAQSLQD